MNLYEISLSLYNNICVCGFLIRVRFLGFPISKEMEVLGFVLLYEDFFFLIVFILFSELGLLFD